jgi:CheY-like chemotaxis protein
MTDLSSPPFALSALSVLLIDDDLFMLDLVATMLRKLGITRLALAPDGRRGVAAVAAAGTAPDVVICDLNMPGMDGFQVMEHMAGRDYKGGLIVLTGLADRVRNSAAVMGRFHQLNVICALAKPVTPQALRSALAAVPAPAAWR